MRHVFVLALVLGVAGWAAAVGSAQITTTCAPNTGVTVTSPLTVANGKATVGVSVAAGCTSTVRLVSYTAPSGTFDAQTASQQVIFAQTVLQPNATSLTVDVPSCFYQVDLIYGDAITQLGPAGSTNFYDAQNRLIATTTGGTTTCEAPPTCPTQNAVTVDTNGFKVANGQATVSFHVAAGCSNVQLSLVSYSAPGPTFSQSTASQQVLFKSVTPPPFNSGGFSMTVAVPSCFFQVDFVRGTPIEQLGPAGSNNFYSAQGRLIAALNGGTACTTETHTSGGTVNTPAPTVPTVPNNTQTVVQQHSVAAVPAPSITLTKLERDGSTGAFTAGPITAKVGDTIDYQLVVVNTGTTDVSVNLQDPGCTSLSLTGPQAVSAGASLTYTCSHVITAADGASYTNTAVATANNAGPVEASVQSTVVATIGTASASGNTGGVAGASKTIKKHHVKKHKAIKRVKHKAKAARAKVAPGRVTG